MKRLSNINVSDGVTCHLCHRELPYAEALNIEGQEYAYHFCGYGCFGEWQNALEAAGSDMPATSDPGLALNEQVIDRDPAEHMDELPQWNRKVAERIAAQEHIELGRDHWRVLHFLRHRFETHGQSRYARTVAHELDEEFAEQGGSRYLYRLFPNGPVTQGCRIAGIPAPFLHEDRSFGSVM